MSWFASIIIGILTATIGIIGAGVIAGLCTQWYRISNFEGAQGYFVVLIALFGGIIGLTIGVICARIVAAGAAPGFLKALGLSSGSYISLLVIVTFIVRLAADLPTTLHGNAVKLHAEIRCPVGFEIPGEPAADAWYAHIDTRSRRHTSKADLRMKEATLVDGRWMIPVTLSLGTSVREKLLYVRHEDKTELFIPLFPAKPGKKYLSWSQWIEGGWEVGKPKPAPDQAFALRFRLEVCPPEPPAPPVAPVPTDQEIREKKAAEDAAAIVALAPDAPITEWLRFTHYAQPEERRQKAGAAIARRPNIVAEMSPEILSNDHEIADRALRALGVIDPLPAALVEPVTAVGEMIIADVKRFNASKPEDDPRHQAAADIAVRFTGWFVARCALQEKASVDGRAQMEAIASVASIREESYLLRNDVVRLAERYIEHWSPKVESARP